MSSSSSRSNERLTLLESLRDPELQSWAESRRREDLYQFLEQVRETERHRSARLVRTRRRFEEMYLNRDESNSQDSSISMDNCDWPLTEHETNSRDVTAPTPPPITITTESADGSSDEEDLPSPAIMADRLRRSNRWRAESESSDDELPSLPSLTAAASLLNEDSLTNAAIDLGSRGIIRATQRETQSTIEPTKRTDGENENVVEPQAKFFIEKNKSKATITFNPPL
jgi:hypothetical protein